MEEDGCQLLSKEVGCYLLEKLSSLRDEFECVGDVRGKGLMVGVELVQDKACTFAVCSVNSIEYICVSTVLLVCSCKNW